VRAGAKNAFEKRKKELSRLKRQQEKAERKQQRLAERQTRSSDEDPDIAGIVPGPQPTQE
jgi:hypothetical protein